MFSGRRPSRVGAVKGKKKPPAPLAYAVVLEAEFDGLGGDRSFVVTATIAFHHAGLRRVGSLGATGMEVALVPESDLVVKVQQQTAEFLASESMGVPANRIAVSVR
jgi:hypothetical protein